MTQTPGTLLNNRYRIVSILGQGGMGAVYRAIDENLGIAVAVKENLYLSNEYSRQFQREASVLASLRHPNLPRVSDYFILPGQGQYLIMDFIDGEDLRQRIERENIIPEQEALLAGALICEALDYLHTRKPPIIHRDIKPGNIKITPEGSAVLVDFGLVKVMMDSQETTTGARAMTPGYSPPEQYGTARTDDRSDIYSLGATLYAALTGTIPEDGLARFTGKADLTPIRKLNPQISRRTASVIEKALETEPEDRYQTADEFRVALLEAGDLTNTAPRRIGVTPPPPPPPNTLPLDSDAEPPRMEPNPSAKKKRTSRPSRHRKNLLPVLPLALLLVVLGLVIYLSAPNLFARMRSFFAPVLTGNTPTPTVEVFDTPATTPQDIETSVPAVQVTPSPQYTATASRTLPPSPTATITPTDGVTPVATISPTPVEGDSGLIAYASNQSGIMQIWTMHPDGSEQTQLTTLPDGACQPTWSPDGARIAFISPCLQKQTEYEGARIYVMNADGSEITALPVPPSPFGDFDPAWSPDGTRIAFTSLRTDIAHIFVYNLETDRLSELSTDPKIEDRQPSWSPDSEYLAFVHKSSYYQIWTMTKEGREQTRVSAAGPTNNFTPYWSPDGLIIFYSKTSPSVYLPGLVGLRYVPGSEGREFRIPPSGGTDPGPVVNASVSPDGQWIVFEGWPDGSNHDIYLMTVNGQSITRLTTNQSWEFCPSWRPSKP